VYRVEVGGLVQMGRGRTGADTLSGRLAPCSVWNISAPHLYVFSGAVPSSTCFVSRRALTRPCSQIRLMVQLKTALADAQAPP